MRRHMGMLAAAVLLLAISAQAVAGYNGQVPTQVTASGPSGAVTCGDELTITAMVVDQDGKAIEGQQVAWSFAASPSSGDEILQPATTTNAQGNASTTVILSCEAGDRTIKATAGEAFGSVVLSVTGEGLPDTSTAPSETPPWGILLAALAVLVLVGFGARWVVSRR